MIASAFFMLTVLRHLDVTKEHLIRVVNVSNQVCLLPIRNTVNTRLFGAYKPEKIIFDLSHYAKSRPA